MNWWDLAQASDAIRENNHAMQVFGILSKEEIQMTDKPKTTDEERADSYIKSRDHLKFDPIPLEEILRGEQESAFKAGLKAGREDAGVLVELLEQAIDHKTRLVHLPWDDRVRIALKEWEQKK